MTETQKQVVKWLATGRVGMSSKCMAMWLAFGEHTEDRFCPADPDDLDRCLKLLDKAPGLRPLIPKMAEVSKDWAALVPRWDEVEASHLAEVGLGWTKARSAPKTYELMASILRPDRSDMQIAVIEEKKVLDACQDACAVFVDKRRERHTLPDVSSKGWGHRMNWIDVNEARPEGSCFVLVACEGGNVATTFYCENPEYFDYAYGRKLSRKVHGKWSKHFDLARAYGYKITHWAPLPKAPNA